MCDQQLKPGETVEQIDGKFWGITKLRPYSNTYHLFEVDADTFMSKGGTCIATTLSEMIKPFVRS